MLYSQDIRCEMSSSLQQRFIAYLHDELVISQDAIALALRRKPSEVDQLHMILWHYGLISLKQLNSIFDWLENAAA